MVFDLVTISFIAAGILMMILNMKLIYSLFPIVNAFFRNSYGESES